MQYGQYIYESENSKTSDTHRVFLNLSDKINLKKSQIYSFIESYYILYMEKYKKVIQKQQFKKSAPTWRKNFEIT